MSKVSEIKFNQHFKYTRNGEAAILTNLSDIVVKDDTPKEQSPCVQMFACNYRVGKDNVDWETWNGCIYADIDSSKYYKAVRKFNEIELFNRIYSYLTANYYNNFYCMQQSNSGTGYHILFYFDVEKSEINFKKCGQYVKSIIIDTFNSIGAKDIINYPAVLDNRSFLFTQEMFVTYRKFKYGYNELQSFGEFEYIDDYELEEKYILKNNDVNEDLTVNFNLNSYEHNTTKIEAHHNKRMAIYMTLIAVFKDENIVNEHWKYICDNNIFCPDYSSKKMFTEKDRNSWYAKYDKYSYMANIDLLKKFGYVFERTFIPQKVDLIEFDGEPKYIDNDKYLNDVELNLSKDKINLIMAGCGFGKTYWAIKLGENKRVCFISPLTSIIKDSFEKANGWLIFDADHKAVARHIFDNLEDAKSSSWNICTTWESFVINELYNCNFDYVIVDEIHSLFMYDYRVESIRNIIKYFNISSGYKIVMTGTPSLEHSLFDCNKIKVVKEQIKTKCEIVMYDKSYFGYISKDIDEWTKDGSHYAIIFKDTANYKDVDRLANEGISCDIFNKNYADAVKEIIDKQNVRNNVTIVSVYGQAGINLFPDKKTRVYILNNNALAIIQYANRIRNKEMIDKVVIPYNKHFISNDIIDIEPDICYEEVEHKIDLVNQLFSNKTDDIFEVIKKHAIDFKFGLDYQYLDRNNSNKSISLNKDKYDIYEKIQRVSKFESQMQVIYNRLVDNDFEVAINYIKDVNSNTRCKLKTDRFAGQIKKFDFNMVSVDENGRYSINPTNKFKEIVTGDLIETIESVFNYIAAEGKDVKLTWTNMVDNIILNTKTIKKTNIKDIESILRLKRDWDMYYDNAFIKVMSDDKITIEQITAAYVRSVYNSEWTEQDWQLVADESYDTIKHINKVVNTYNNIFDITTADCEQANVPLDDTTNMIYSYVVNKHTRGVKNGSKRGKYKN